MSCFLTGVYSFFFNRFSPPKPPTLMLNVQLFLFNNIPVYCIKINKKPNQVLKIFVIRPKLGVSQENAYTLLTKTTL